MSEVEFVAGRIDEVPAAILSRSVLRARHRDRDYALRRALVVADVLALYFSLVLAMALAGRRGDPFADALWLIPVLPAWALLFRAYALYERPLRRIAPTWPDDASSLIHALLIGTLGVWLFFRFGPVEKMNLEEVILFGVLPLIAVLRVLVCGVNLRIRGPERVLVVAPTICSSVI